MNEVGIEGGQDLVISRNRSAFTLDLNPESNITVNVIHFNFITLTQRTRLGRFIYAIKFVWEHCK